MYFYVVVLHKSLLLFGRSCFRRRCLAPNRFLKYLSEDLFRHTPPQQPFGSQIIRICIGIYRKIDKTRGGLAARSGTKFTWSPQLRNLAEWDWVPFSFKTNMAENADMEGRWVFARFWVFPRPNIKRRFSRTFLMGFLDIRMRDVSQAAQTHYMNADVTLACERCCVTNVYLQRLVWDRSVFLKRDKKMLCF